MSRREDYRKVVFVDINVEDCQVLARHYNISHIPTFVCIEGGKPKAKFSGADIDKLTMLIETGRV